ncbi:GNAT family N-acetyltransferase [Blastococcus sp. TF02-8]|uniref:GNAT family N-acetyltransferase n=1 Tax=Blastococcus sp. TF02-8 TaxID=2250574 RepID=UPI00141354E3|nr:GNAT family N-acetyltransferase [Blastococcus sp. TF02-8]
MSVSENGPAWQWRTARVGDLSFIHDAELAYIREREPEQEAAWLGSVEQNRRLWSANLARTTIADLDGTPVSYGMWAELDGVATVVTLHVSPALRRRGLGAALLTAVADDARRSGHAVLALGVHRANPARHLYESAGFLPAGVDGDYLLFRRTLLSPPPRSA